MKPLTFFIAETERDVQLFFIDFKDKINCTLGILLDDFRKKNNVIACKKNGAMIITTLSKLVDEDGDFTEVDNPYISKTTTSTENDTNEDVFSLDDVQKDTPDIAQKDTPDEIILNLSGPKKLRRKRIDHILNTINFEIESNKLDKLIQVIDLDNQFEGKTTLDQIFSLQ